MTEDLEDLAGSAVTQAMTTMTKFKVQSTHEAIDFSTRVGLLASAVGLIAKITGLVCLCAIDRIARLMACRLTRREDSEAVVDEMVIDAMGVEAMLQDS